MNQDPRVRSSVMFGRGRFNTGILIDPAEQYVLDPDDGEALSKFRNDIWWAFLLHNACRLLINELRY